MALFRRRGIPSGRRAWPAAGCSAWVQYRWPSMQQSRSRSGGAAGGSAGAGLPPTPADSRLRKARCRSMTARPPADGDGWVCLAAFDVHQNQRLAEMTKLDGIPAVGKCPNRVGFRHRHRLIFQTSATGAQPLENLPKPAQTFSAFKVKGACFRGLLRHGCASVAG